MDEKMTAQWSFTEEERSAVVTLLMRLFCADGKIVTAELTSRRAVYQKLGLSYEDELHTMKLPEAKAVFAQMMKGKRQVVLNVMNEIAGVDGDVSSPERTFIDSL